MSLADLSGLVVIFHRSGHGNAVSLRFRDSIDLVEFKKNIWGNVGVD